jgi:hypothetical protein
MKIHPVGAELFHAGRQTEMTKLIVAFCNFANAPKNQPCDIALAHLYHLKKKETNLWNP